MRSRPRLAWLGWALMAGFACVAVLAPVLAPHDPRLPLAPPLAPPTRDHLLGTNDVGQDILSQVIHGTRSSLIVAAAVTAVSTTLSWIVGLVAGFVRRLEGSLMGVTDLILALPDLPLILLVLTLAGATRFNLILVLGLLSWPAFARIVRSIVIGARSSPYVEASRSLGASSTHIMARHLLPATLEIVPTKLVLTMRFAVFAEATLAFLGLGRRRDRLGRDAEWRVSRSPALLAARLAVAGSSTSDRDRPPHPRHGLGWQRTHRPSFAQPAPRRSAKDGDTMIMSTSRQIRGMLSGRAGSP